MVYTVDMDLQYIPYMGATPAPLTVYRFRLLEFFCSFHVSLKASMVSVLFDQQLAG